MHAGWIKRSMSDIKCSMKNIYFTKHDVSNTNMQLAACNVICGWIRRSVFSSDLDLVDQLVQVHSTFNS